MKVTRFAIDPALVERGQQIGAPMLRTNLYEAGCSIPTWISVSDGDVGLTVELNYAEAQSILGGDVRLTQGVKV